MTESLRVLLSGLIDYAGLFPPARLPLEEALRNYARYRQEADRWMLGRFICPAARLGELEPFHELFLSAPPFLFSVLGRDVSHRQEAVAGSLSDFHSIRAFRQRHGDRVRIDAFEVRLAFEILELVTDAPRTEEAVSDLIDKALESQGLPLAALYYEPTFGPEWSAAVATLARSLRRDPLQRQGLKLRCGGLEASAFPSPEQVAFTIVACRDAGVSLKFTAGLHHPLRRFDAGVNTHMHGFLNVFGAGVLAHARRLNQNQVREIIEDEDSSHFQFDDDAIRWREHRATVAEITAIRRTLLASFGSCSFDEPREDLRALGLM